MGVTTNLINKPFNPRAQDQSPKGFNRAKLFSGKALDFDGVNDEISLGTPSFLNINDGAITLACYGKIDTYPANHHLFRQENSGGKRILFAYQNNSTSITLGTYANGSYSELDATLTSSQNEQIKNEIVFLVVTHDTNGDKKVYFNGQLIASSNVGGGLVSTNTTNATIGADNGLEFWDGLIANFKAFNVALTAAQVADLYNNPEKVVPTGVSNTALKLWLPMMEGAGTTAYDGSGNGNHGTISGATYVNGIGAPVSQSAVMNWNKGTNLVPYSEDLSQWTINNVVVTTNATTAPDGSSNADEVENDANNSIHRVYRICGANSSTNDVAFSVYLKYKDHQYVSFGPTDDSIYRGQFVVDLINGTITDTYTDNANVVSSSLTNVGNGWYKLEGVITPTTAWNNNLYAFVVLLGGSTFSSGPVSSVGTSVYVWGAQVEYASINGPYIPTLSTAQTSSVLLPQGLTTGRDITGVNLFENVRKQGALNLDGKSWAEVHDNASLDITSAITLEAWYYHTGLGTKIIQGRWSTQVDNSYLMYVEGNKIKFVGNDGSSTFGGNDSTTDLSLDQFNHVVITYDRTNLKYYLNGVLIDTFAYTVSLNPNATVALDIGRNDGISGVYTGANYNNTPIAQPRIYNRALTAEEVQRSYDSGKNIYTNS